MRSLLMLCACVAAAAHLAAALLVPGPSAAPADEVREPTALERAAAEIIERAPVLDDDVIKALAERTGVDEVTSARAVGEALARTRTAAGALEACGPSFDFGCYQGVLAGIAPPDAARACAGAAVRDAQKGDDCANALGRVGAERSLPDLTASLRACDLEVPSMRRSCTDGVFGQAQRTALRDMGSPGDAASWGPLARALIDPARPGWPCTQVDLRDRQSCYQQKPVLFMALAGGEVRPAAELCLRLESPFEVSCFFGLGQRLGQVPERCAEVPAAGRVRCELGAATAAQVSPLELAARCPGLASVDDRSLCAHIVGVKARRSESSGPSVPEVCARFAAFEETECRRAAGFDPR